MNLVQIQKKLLQELIDDYQRLVARAPESQPRRSRVIAKVQALLATSPPDRRACARCGRQIAESHVVNGLRPHKCPHGFWCGSNPCIECSNRDPKGHPK